MQLRKVHPLLRLRPLGASQDPETDGNVSETKPLFRRMMPLKLPATEVS